MKKKGCLRRGGTSRRKRTRFDCLKRVRLIVYCRSSSEASAALCAEEQGKKRPDDANLCQQTINTDVTSDPSKRTFFCKQNLGPSNLKVAFFKSGDFFVAEWSETPGIYKSLSSLQSKFEIVIF